MLSHQPLWTRLQSLTLKVQFTVYYITATLVLLKNYPHSMLKDVLLELEGLSVSGTCEELRVDPEASSELFEALEQTLLRFPQPRVACIFDNVRDGTVLFWTQTLGGRHFPTLFQRGAFTVTSKEGECHFHQNSIPTQSDALITINLVAGVGHDSSIWDLVISPDGKWVATASSDFTIILWDHQQKCKNVLKACRLCLIYELMPGNFVDCAAMQSPQSSQSFRYIWGLHGVFGCGLVHFSFACQYSEIWVLSEHCHDCLTAHSSRTFFHFC